MPLDEREREYSPSSCVGGNIDPFIAAYVERSAQAHASLRAAGRTVTEVAYGPEPSQTIDLVTPPPTQRSTPLLVYIHGGYWQQLSKVESFFAAEHCIAHGIAFAAVDYTLAPHATLDEIVAECRSAVAKLRDITNEHRVDPDRIVVAGSSAGGHLSAMVGLGIGDGWRPAGVGLISGVFELEPLIGTSINDAVGLDVAAALRNSPQRMDLADFPRTLIAIGSNETNEFKRQSLAMEAALQQLGTPVEHIEIDERNHFDVVLDLCNADSELGRLMLQLIAATGASS